MEDQAAKPQLVDYQKQKLVYSVRCDSAGVDLIFMNVKAAVTWFADQSLFPSDLSSDYDRILRTIRALKPYVILVGSDQYVLKQLVVVGRSVKSRKRLAPAPAPACDHSWCRHLDGFAVEDGRACVKCEIVELGVFVASKTRTTSIKAAR